MGRTYAYCMGKAPPPRQYRLAHYVTKYGAMSVLNRPMSPREVREAELAETIIDLFRERAASEVDYEWEITHPEGTKLLTAAFMEYEKWLKVFG